MAIKIKLAANSTPGAVPSASYISQMETGEVVINTANGRMWTKHSNGSLILMTLTGNTGPTGPTGPIGPPGPPAPVGVGVGVGCFLGSEYVLMSNGTEKRLDQVQTGEYVSCAFNRSAPVFAIRKTHVRDNNMFKLNNDLITTGEHPFWSPAKKEWLVCDKKDDLREIIPWRDVEIDGTKHLWKMPTGLNPRQMKVGDKVQVGDRSVTIFKIEPITLPDNSPSLITLITTSSMIIRNGWVVSGWSGKDFDKPIRDDMYRRLKMLRGELENITIP
jgi:hypothetical protein